MTSLSGTPSQKEAKLRKAVAKAAAAEQAAEAAASSRNSSIQGPLQEHFRALCRQHGCGFAFSFCINARAERAMALSSLPDLLQSPVGRPRVELPVALLEARPALQADDGGGNLLVSDEEIEPSPALAEPEIPHDVKEIHMSVVLAKGSNMHVIEPAIATGRRLGREDIMVSIHAVVAKLDADTCVLARPKHIGELVKSRLGVLATLNEDSDLTKKTAK